MRAVRSMGQINRLRPRHMPGRPRPGLQQMSRQHNAATRHVWQSNDDIDSGLDEDVIKRAESDMEMFDDPNSYVNVKRADTVDLADRRANVLHSFLQSQNEWLYKLAQEMRHVVLLVAKEQGENEDMVQIPWRRWAEFSTGVVVQTHRTQRMLSNQTGIFSICSKASDLEQSCVELETMLARYEMHNDKLLQELGYQQRWGMDMAPFDAATCETPPPSARRCLCVNGCRCWSATGNSASLDPVHTISYGWLKNDDLRLHRRIINEQRLVVERQTRLCIQQETALEKLSQRLANSQKELVETKHQNSELDEERDRLKKMLRSKVESLKGLKGQLDASNQKLVELSKAIKQKQDYSWTDNLKVFSYDRSKASIKIQRVFRHAKAVRRFRETKAATILQRAGRAYLERKTVTFGEAEEYDRPDGVDPSAHIPELFARIVETPAVAPPGWGEESESETVLASSLLSTLNELEALEVEILDQRITLASEGDSASRAEPDVSFDDIVKRMTLHEIGQL